MIFSTQNQLTSIIIFIFFGIVVGIISILYFIFFVNNFQKKLIKLINLTIFYAFFNIFFIILLNFFNFGIFSITLLLSYILGFCWIKKLLHKSVVILEKKWYTKINNIKLFISKSKSRNKDKLNELSKES